jgi:hypothetical protein
MKIDNIRQVRSEAVQEQVQYLDASIQNLSSRLVKILDRIAMQKEVFMVLINFSNN